jgi:hypothetical protein
MEPIIQRSSTFETLSNAPNPYALLYLICGLYLGASSCVREPVQRHS